MAHQNTPPKTLHRRNPDDSCRAGEPCATCRPYSNMVSPALSDNGADFILNNSFYKTCPADVRAEVKSKPFTPEEKKDVQEVLDKMCPLMQCPNPKLKHIGRTTKAIERDKKDGVCDPDVLGGQWLPGNGAIILTDKASEPADFKDPRTQFKAVVAHEVAHGTTNEFDPRTCKSYSDWRKNPLMKDWGKAAGWNEELKELEPGATGSPTPYGNTDAREDLSESMMLYLYDPAKLKEKSAERYEFIENLFK